MIKGTQKQMIVLRTANSRYFDEAYFVLRREIKPQKDRKTDMLGEANRILQESALSPSYLQKKRTGWIWFLAGLLPGAGVAALILILL